MEYLSTRNCLETILRSMGTLEVVQLERFFRNAPDKNALLHYINQYVGYRIFDYNETRKRLTYHGFPGIKPDVIDRRITAFWILAAFGYDNIREVYLLKYPSQILFITEDGDTYDITVCSNEMEAKQAVRARKRIEVPNAEDDVNHIAIVRKKEVGDAILPYGFDSYCILDSDKMPEYYSE